MSEPVTTATLTIVQVFWRLEKKLAQRKHFPSVNWLYSYSKYLPSLEPFYEQSDPDFLPLRKKFREILQLEDDLTEIVQLVGKDSLGESDKVTLDIARLIKEDFLQQNGYSTYDKFCPFYKTIWMMRNFVLFYNLAQQTIEQAPQDMKITWGQISEYAKEEKERLTQMKFEPPSQSEDENVIIFKKLYDDIQNRFKSFNETLV